MFTYILIAPISENPPLPAELLAKTEGVQYDYMGACMVEGLSRQKDGWIRVTRNDEIRDDYEDGALERIDVDPNRSAFYLVEGGVGVKNYAAVFLLYLPTDKFYTIDNDHGCIGDVAMFRNLLLQGKDWLYCKSF